MDLLSSEVGSGSLADCLSGSALINVTTSTGVTGTNSFNTQPAGTGVKCGASALAVAARTAATLSSKKSCKTDALMSVTTGARPRPSSSLVTTTAVGDVYY